MLGVPKNGTTTHVVVPSQHKHKTRQNYYAIFPVYAGEA